MALRNIANTSRLFALEGTLTGLIGIASYFYLPPSPTQTASFSRGKDGWFNEREEKIMVGHVPRPSNAVMANTPPGQPDLAGKQLPLMSKASIPSA